MTLQIEGQTNIFDFLDAPIEPVKHLTIGATVKVKYYEDELAYVHECLPQLLGEGEILEVHNGFCRVMLAGKATLIDNEKLTLI